MLTEEKNPYTDDEEPEVYDAELVENEEEPEAEGDKHRPATGEELLEGTQARDDANRELVRQIQEGSKRAEGDLCLQNRRLVRYFAERGYRSSGGRLELDDLEQEGYMGLLEAARKFDFSKGVKFSTYAAYWIRLEISRFVKNNGSAVRIPIRRLNEINHVIQAVNANSDLVRRDDRVRKAAEELHMTPEDVERDLKLYENYYQMSSLDKKIGDDEDTSVGDMQAVDEGRSVEDYVVDEDTRKHLMAAIDSLSARDRDILELRFGLKDGQVHTLEDIGEQYGLTRERVRQIVNHALKKLSTNENLKGMDGNLQGM